MRASQNHRAAVIEIDLEGVKTRVSFRIRFVAIDFKGFHSGSADWGRPSDPLHDARARRNTQVPRYWKPLFEDNPVLLEGAEAEENELVKGDAVVP